MNFVGTLIDCITILVEVKFPFLFYKKKKTYCSLKFFLGRFRQQPIILIIGINDFLYHKTNN